MVPGPEVVAGQREKKRVKRGKRSLRAELKEAILKETVAV